MGNKIHIRCRAIILNDGRLLTVKHSNGNDFYSLPGGHLEHGEKIDECVKHEVKEELGIDANVGRLLYINNFTDANGEQSIEFFMEITNGEDFINTENLAASHAHELAEICWIEADDGKKVLPKQIRQDFDSNIILSDVTRFID